MSGIIEVGNLREPHTISSGTLCIRVDRTSILGNPFLLPTEGWRKYVIKSYGYWLDAMLKGEGYIDPQYYEGLKFAPKYKAPKPTDVIEEGRRLRGLYKRGEHITLMCWCHPLPCHADVIKKVIEGY